MRKLLFALAGLGIVALPAQIQPAMAAPPQGVQGQDCGSLASQVNPSQIWTTSFRGSRVVQWTFEVESRDWYQASPCFRTQADCKAWLYWTQTAYPDMMNFRPCHRGI